MSAGPSFPPGGSATPPPAGGQRGRLRAGLVLGGVIVFVLLLLAGLVIYLTGLFGSSEDEAAAPPGPSSAPPVAEEPAVTEQDLATRPMLDVPLSASAPHALATTTAGPPIELPAPSMTVGTLVPQGFPDTEEGAAAQLAAFTQVALSGADPADYIRAYHDLAEPGAPPAETTTLYREVWNFRQGAHLPKTGPKPGLRITWTPVSAQVKGSIDDYTVVCVLGEFAADYEGRVVTQGLGNCQAMRRVEVAGEQQWRIASGPAAATAPSPWPGSAEAVAAGYRDIIR